MFEPAQLMCWGLHTGTQTQKQRLQLPVRAGAGVGARKEGRNANRVRFRQGVGADNLHCFPPQKAESATYFKM